MNVRHSLERSHHLDGAADIYERPEKGEIVSDRQAEWNSFVTRKRRVPPFRVPTLWFGD